MQTKKIIEEIVCWLKDYCEKNSQKGFVIGVSGGIDSAVTSTLCALTGLPVLAVNMPICQDKDQVSLSNQHIEWLKERYKQVEGILIDLTYAFQTLEKTFPQNIQDGLTMANSRSRLRMITLYAHASHHKMLVVGTGNKVEDFGVGFFTKYGDGGVDLSPIGDLLKSEVYLIGRELGIIEQIMNAPPTDGLWTDSRTDESQIGATYAEMEWAMAYEADSSQLSKLSLRQREVLNIYNKIHQSNLHKMVPIPVFKVRLKS